MKPLTPILMTLFTAGLAMADDFPDPADLPAHPELPDPLVMRDGTPVETAADWTEKRRPEVMRLFEHYMYGRSPELPSLDSMQVEVLFEKPFHEGKGTLKELRIQFPPEGTPPMHLLIAIPNAEEPVPVFVGPNFQSNHSTTEDPDVKLSEVWLPSRYSGVVDNRATEEHRGRAEDRWPFELGIDRGYAMATVYHGDLDPDFEDFSNGVHPAFYEGGQTKPAPDEWGAIGAWAWGLRIAATVLIADPAIDSEKVCVMGHSRNGKTALWAGAQDERFALVVSNHSGCGGAALSRPRRGETLVKINTNFPHWFNDHFMAFNDREDHLPLDQHMLLALIAPRPVLVCSAVGDEWADPKGEFGSCVGADSVYRLLGTDGLSRKEFPDVNDLIDSTIGYHIRPGKHGIGEEDWAVYFDFADKQLE